MADINLKTETPDTSLPSTGFLFGADSQSAASPSVYSTQAVATALLGSTSLTGATVTADSPVLNLAQTWNNSGVTFTGLKFNVPTDTSAAGSLLMDLQVGGSSRFNVGKTGNLKLGVSPTGTNQAGTNVIIAGSQGTGTGAGGSIVFQVAPAGSSGTAQNALATFLEATSARAFNLYNTTDVTTNFERGKIAWESNVLRIGTEKGGTGTARALEFQTDGTSRWSIGATTGHLLAAADNTYDIGASGATRPRNLFVGTSITAGSSITGSSVAIDSSVTAILGVSPLIGATESSSNGVAGLIGYGANSSGPNIAFFKTRSSNTTSTAVVSGDGLGGFSFRGATGSSAWAIGGSIRAFVDGTPGAGDMPGRLEFRTTPDGSGTEATRLIINNAGLIVVGATQANTVPALKASSASLQVRLADDTGYTTIDAQLRSQGTAPASAAATGTAGDIRYDADYIYICTATDTWKRVAIATWP